MSAISQKSITGITSITTPAGVDNQLTLHTNNTTERVKIDVAGNVHVNNHISIAGITTTTEVINIDADNKKLQIGASQDLQLFHDGGHSRITNTTGILKLTAPAGQSVRVVPPDDSGNVAVFHIDGSTHLYYDSAHKFSTVSDGIEVVGNMSIMDSIYHRSDDNTKIRFPANDTVTVETSGSERLRITSDGKIGIGIASPTFAAGGGVHLKGGNEFTSYKVSAHTNTGVDFAQDATGVAYVYNRDNADLILGTNNTQRFRINNSGAIGLGGANYGSSGQVLTSQGSGSAVTWSTISGTTINNNADNRIITGSGTANTLNGEANITYDATTSLLKLATASSTSTDAVLLHLVGGGTSDRGLKISTGRASGAGQNHAAAIYDAINSESSGYGSQHRFKIAGTDCFTIGYNGDFGFVGVNDNVPYPDTVGGNTVNTCLELGSPSGTDTASVIKFNGRDGSGNLNKCQMQWCGANNRFDITVNGNQALQIQPNKDVEVTDGDLVIGTSGHGISFSATGNAGNSASMQNELLDDYEEGTWTPFFYAWIGGGVPATTDIAVGTYTKIGRCVHINFDLKADRGSMAHNYITMGGLPFAHLGSRGGFASIAWTEYVGSENSTSATRGHGIEFGGGATVHCWLTGYTSTSSYLPTYLSTSYMSNGSHTRIVGSATYFTNA